MISMDPLEPVDPEIAGLIRKDVERQNTHIHLIASENFASPAVMAASGSVFTNKYAEGYPGRRYYEGCQVVDEMEQLAIDRAIELFGAEHANVQSHSGAQANMGVYFSLLEPGDKVLGMRLDQGGHLTHGSPVNFSGLYYDFVAYGVDPDTELIDMDEVRSLALEHRPKIVLAGYSAYSRTLDYEGFRSIADEIGAVFMVDAAHFIGLVAGRITSFAGATCRHRHRHHPQGVARAARWPDPQQGAIRRRHRQGGVPERAGRADRVSDRGQGRVLPRGTSAGVQDIHRSDRRQRHGDGGIDPGGGGARGVRRHRQPPVPGRSPLGRRGPDGQGRRQDCSTGSGITLNFNTIPFDPRPPYRASGLRIGTPAMTTQGMKEGEAAEVAAPDRPGAPRSERAVRRRRRGRAGFGVGRQLLSVPAEFAGHV